MPIPMTKNNGFAKPYNIVLNDADNSADINMYGEVVATRPTDWWTGEPIPGNFIALDDFMRDLDELKTKDNITIHINSVGGDFFAGLAIYNRLRTLGASITTINDSLAASAGSIIFMAGDKGKRKVHAASNLMVHSVMGFMYGYYNVDDLKCTIKTLQAHDKALVAAYVQATGLDEETVKATIGKDTYMTGQEAVDLGWADEVVSGDGAGLVNMKLAPDKSCLMVNGMAVAARCFGKLPASIQQMSEEEWAKLSTPANSMQPAPQADINTSQNGGTDMEIKNIEDMRNAFPDFVAQVEAAARADGARAERERIQGIEDIQSAIGDTDLVRNAKFGNNPMSAQDLAFASMKKQAAIGANMLGQMARDTNGSGAADVVANPAATQEVTPDSPAAIMAQAKADVAAYKNMKEVR